MAINLTSEYSRKVAERFSAKSFTDAFAGKDYDFSGVKSIKIFSIDTVPIVDYTRSGTSRYGTITELGDTVQEMIMTQDKSFAFSIDEGNAEEQYNIKQTQAHLKRQWDEKATPMIDMYRFNKWINGAGLVSTSASALTKSNIIETIMLASAAMSNELVPLENRVIFIRESVYTNAKLAPEIVGINSLGASAVSHGVVGELDGMKVVRVPDKYLPTGVNFLIKYKSATVDPIKLKYIGVQKRPLGIDGDVGECRFMFDSFVLGAKVNGVCANILSANVVANPTISIASNQATITCGTSGATITYTLDGSDPKTSPTAATYSAAVTLSSGQTIRAYASKAGLINSGVVSATN